MKVLQRFVVPAFAVVILASPLAPSALRAQSISLGLRGSGGFPTGSFAESQNSANGAMIEGAKSGFGYGLDAGLSFGPLGVYAGFDHVKFDCESATCRSDGKYTLQGVTAGVKLTTPTMSLLRPYVKGGVTFNDLRGGFGGSSSNVLTTDKTPGYELGVGADVALPGMGLVSLTPQLRYVGQNLKAKVPGVNAPAASGQSVNYFTFDLGLSLHTPFGK